MENAKITQSLNIKPHGESFYKLIEEFISDNFVLTEQNLLDFATKLHELDYENKYEKMYAVKTINSVLLGGETNHLTKEIVVAVNNLLSLEKNVSSECLLAYKIEFLNSYFHEARHEKQYDICKNIGLNSSSYNRVMTYEFLNGEVYNQYCSLIEIDARINSIERIVALIKRGVLPNNPEVYTLLMEECIAILDGINNNLNGTKPYQENPFDYKEILNTILTKYTNYSTIYKFNTASFKDSFVNDLTKRINNFKNETLKYLMFNIVVKFKVSNVASNYFSIDKNDRNSYLKFFFDELLNYKDSFVNFITLKAEETRKKSNKLSVTMNDITDFLIYKKIPPTEENIIQFMQDNSRHAEFEKFLKNKQKFNRYQNLLSEIFDREQ